MIYRLKWVGPIAIFVLVFWISARVGAQSEKYETELGTVDFSVNCDQEVVPDMQKGLALLHHMMYADAENVFRSVIEKDDFLLFWLNQEIANFIQLSTSSS